MQSEKIMCSHTEPVLMHAHMQLFQKGKNTEVFLFIIIIIIKPTTRVYMRIKLCKVLKVMIIISVFKMEANWTGKA